MYLRFLSSNLSLFQRPFCLRAPLFIRYSRKGLSTAPSEPSPECNKQGDDVAATTTATTQPPSEKDTADRFANLQDAYLRSLAEMENLRQRTRREIDNASQFAIQRFAKDIIGVADVLEAAIEQAPKNTTNGSHAGVTADDAYNILYKGLEMTLEELRKVFKSHGVTPIEPLRQPFDPNQHMALYEVPSEDVKAGTVVSVQKKGYLLNGRIIRAAQVAVSKKQQGQ